MPGLAAIILAAGGSTRMGTPKQLLQLNGMTLIRRAVETVIEADCEPVLVVVGSNADAVWKDVRDLKTHRVDNANWQSGIGSSIRSGAIRLAEISPESSATVLLLCDQPLISPAHIRQLIEAQTTSAKPVAVSSFSGTVGPPIVVRRDFFPRLQSLPDDRGAKFIWLDKPKAICRVPCDQAATDIDTPGDFQQLQRIFRLDSAG